MRLLLNLEILVGLGSCPCVAMYCIITSSVTFPLLAAKYPLVHKCLPKIADADARTPSATCDRSSPSDTASPCSPTDRRHRHKQMDMVLAHMPFDYLNI